MNSTRRISKRRWIALAALVATMLAAPSAAHAWWRGGFGIGIGIGPVFVAPPPYYAAPYPAPYPGYWPPPPAYPPGYPPPEGQGAGPASTGPAGPSCYAGQYVCPLNKPPPADGSCSCPTNNNGRIAGHVG